MIQRTLVPFAGMELAILRLNLSPPSPNMNRPTTIEASNFSQGSKFSIFQL